MGGGGARHLMAGGLLYQVLHRPISVRNYPVRLSVGLSRPLKPSGRYTGAGSFISALLKFGEK